jgi:hypothetical protein
MGPCGKSELVCKTERPTFPVDFGADELLLASTQQRWQEAVRGGGNGAR